MQGDEPSGTRGGWAEMPFEDARARERPCWWLVWLKDREGPGACGHLQNQELSSLATPAPGLPQTFRYCGVS